MQREGLRQRIQYLVEHGGTYPEKPANRYAIAVVCLLAALVVAEAVELYHLLR